MPSNPELSKFEAIRYRLGRTIPPSYLCHNLIASYIETVYRNEIPSWGCRIDTGSQVPPRTKAALFWHIYETDEIRFVRKYLPPSLDVIEVGGSIGVVSCQIRKGLSSSRNLVVVEADSELAAIARKNLRFNSSKSFTVVEQAVDYTQPNAEHVSFQKSDDSSTGHIRPLIDSSSSSSISAQRVPRTTIGEIIRRHGIGEFSLVADIEGAEVGLLYNGEEHLASCDTVIIELHREKLNGRVISIQQSRDRIIDLGFDLIDERNNVFVFKKNK